MIQRTVLKFAAVALHEALSFGCMNRHQRTYRATANLKSFVDINQHKFTVDEISLYMSWSGTTPEFILPRTVNMRVQDVIRPTFVILLMSIHGCATQEVVQSKAMTAQEIVQVSHAGIPDKDIIRKIRDSDTACRLSEEDRSKLHDEGVSNAVLDYMQRTYLDAIRYDARLCMQSHWHLRDGYWYVGPAFGWPYAWH